MKGLTVVASTKAAMNDSGCVWVNMMCERPIFTPPFGRRFISLQGDGIAWGVEFM